jgi:hypothetical protein
MRGRPPSPVARNDDDLRLLHYDLLPHLDPLETPAGAVLELRTYGYHSER